MLNKYVRWIDYYDLVLNPSPAEAPPIKLAQMVEPLRKHFCNGDAKQLLNNDTAACRIADLRLDEERNVLILLLQFADTTASDPAYVLIPTGKVRIGEREEEEGVGVSAHLMISLTETKPDTVSYLCLVEHVPGLNRTLIQRFLRYQFREVSENILLTYKNLKGQDSRYRPLVTLDPYPSVSMAEAMRTGELKEFMFIRRVPVKHMDELTYVRERIERVSLAITPDQTFQGRLKAMGELMNFAKEQDGQDIRIRYRDTEEQKDHTVSLDQSTNNDNQQSLLVKSYKVAVGDPLNDCADQLHEGIIERMFELMRQMR
jgi:hypothetical protein